ncbi:MAG: MurR/RpiR family transcriptional regulator [Desulfarculaceae bacterium]
MGLVLHPEILFVNGPVRLTKTQLKVADYILSHASNVQFMTAADLGRELEVSDATVVRLAQTLGFEGFSQLKKHLRQHIMPSLDTVSRMEETVEDIHSVGDVLRAVMQTDLENLRQTAEATSSQTFSDVVGVLKRANEIHIIGLRSAHALASFLASGLRFLGRRVHLLSPGIGYLWADVRGLDKGSVLVAFSFPRYTKVTIEVAEEAHRAGATVISFTDSSLSPLAIASDYVLPASYSIKSYMESYVAALSLLNALLTAIAFKDAKSSLNHLGQLEKIWREKGVYFHEQGG